MIRNDKQFLQLGLKTGRQVVFELDLSIKNILLTFVLINFGGGFRLPDVQHQLGLEY